MASKNPEFSNRLRDIVTNELKWEYSQFAKEIKIHKNSVTNYLEKGVVPEWDILMRICDEIGVTAEYLLKGEPAITTSIAESITKYGQPPLSAEEQDLINKAHKIIKSKTLYSAMLISNINAFYQAIEECDNLKARIEALEKGHCKKPLKKNIEKKAM